MLTRNQKIKARKKKDRERRNNKVRNLNRNLPAIMFELKVEISPDVWHSMKYFRSKAGVGKYQANVEKNRSEGKEIIAAKVVNVKTGKVFLEIPGSKLKGLAPDKIADGPKADPDVKA